ncbi:MAG: PorT family protein [Cytophagales bacterium]|nr:PorT family protein [Cytophagales bacterium]
MRIGLFVFLSFVSSSIWGQTTITYDTLVKVQEIEEGIFDTVYYVQKHIHIDKKVVVVDTVRGNKWAIDGYGGITLGGKANYIESNLTFNSNTTSGYHFGSSMYYNFPKKWSLRGGLTFDYQQVSANYTKAKNYTVETSEEVNDTIDTYYTINDGDTSFFHIIETKTIKNIEEKTDYSSLDYNWKIYYLKVPLQLNYAFEKNRWSYNVLVGASFNFLLKQIESNTEQQQETQISFFPSVIISLQSGYFLGNSTFFYLEPIYQKSFLQAHNKVFSNNNYSISLGLKQFF